MKNNFLVKFSWQVSHFWLHLFWLQYFTGCDDDNGQKLDTFGWHQVCKNCEKQILKDFVCAKQVFMDRNLFSFYFHTICLALCELSFISFIILSSFFFCLCSPVLYPSWDRISNDLRFNRSNFYVVRISTFFLLIHHLSLLFSIDLNY